jgi:predicted DCC family thiol-disulfide oxidoreductase YuxK
VIDPRQSIPRPVLLYEAGCRFCRWAARVVAALDRAGELAFLPLEADEAGLLLASIPEDSQPRYLEAMKRQHVAGGSA